MVYHNAIYRSRWVCVPGKLAVRCSINASWLAGLWAAFIAEMAKHKISPSGMNCDWLIGDMLIGDTSPAGEGGGGTGTSVRSWMNSGRSVWSYDVMVKQQQCVRCLERLFPSSLCFLSFFTAAGAASRRLANRGSCCSGRDCSTRICAKPLIEFATSEWNK